MAVSVRIEDEAFSDRRYDVFARILGLPDADCARGKMAAVWRQCTQEQIYVLNGEMVRAILGENGPDALIISGLGEVVDGGIRISGTRGRIEWLARLRKNGRKGGRPKKPNGNHLVSRNTAPEQPGANPPAPAPAPVTTEEEKREGLAPLDLFKAKVDLAAEQAIIDRANQATRPAKPKTEPKPPHPDRQRVIDGFHERFKAAYGTKPTWDGKALGLISSLLKKHKAETLFERMDFMFSGRSKWPPPPYSLDVFVANIDRWVETTVRPSSNLQELG